MPTYLLKCSNEHTFDRYIKLKDLDQIQYCECGAIAKRQICAPMIAPMFEDYQSPIDGKPITSKRKRLDDLARNDCIPYEEGMLQDHNKRVSREEKELDKRVDETVDSTIENMKPKERENLFKELSHGADLNFTRS